MDLRMHLGVIWRWRLIVLLGLLLAGALALFSVCRVSFAHGLSVSYRDGQTWRASETLLLGNLNQDPNAAASASTSVYVQIANSATIRTRVLPGGRPTKTSGDYVAFQVLDQNGQPQPIVTIDGLAGTSSRAAKVARRASFQFRSYITSKGTRVTVLTPASARDADVAKGRKFTAPILIFLAVLLATLGLAYLLENLYPRQAAGQKARRKRSGPAQTTATPLRDRKAPSLAEHSETTRRTETARRP